MTRKTKHIFLWQKILKEDMNGVWLAFFSTYIIYTFSNKTFTVTRQLYIWMYRWLYIWTYLSSIQLGSIETFWSIRTF